MLTAYYDGGCPLCRREIDFLRRKVEAGAVMWVDITGLPGDRVAADLERPAALARFHVRLADGRLVSGVAAFAALWSRTRGLRWLGRLAGLRLLRGPLELAYCGFLKVRPRVQRLFAHEVCAIDGGCGTSPGATRRDRAQGDRGSSCPISSP